MSPAAASNPFDPKALSVPSEVTASAPARRGTVAGRSS
jgi:hypothetical protein